MRAAVVGRVETRAAVVHVARGPAHQGVVPVVAVQGVGAALALQGVGARAAREGVGQRAADQQVAVRSADQGLDVERDLSASPASPSLARPSMEAVTGALRPA